jgi:hypothetical protein
MQMTLEFKLPEEQHEASVAQAGLALLIILTDLLSSLRTKRKYDNQDTIVIVDLEDELRGAISDEGLSHLF